MIYLRPFFFIFFWHHFSGDLHSPHDFTEFILSSFPKFRDAGGFVLMKISGNTPSHQLTLLPCPNEGYTVQYLKEPSLLIHHATIYIRPLQCSVSVEQVINVKIFIMVMFPHQLTGFIFSTVINDNLFRADSVIACDSMPNFYINKRLVHLLNAAVLFSLCSLERVIFYRLYNIPLHKQQDFEESSNYFLF